ncbi:hypothetical protein ACJX0J_017540, partial [Zea mays]
AHQCNHLPQWQSLIINSIMLILLDKALLGLINLSHFYCSIAEGRGPLILGQARYCIHGQVDLRNLFKTQGQSSEDQLSHE